MSPPPRGSRASTRSPPTRPRRRRAQGRPPQADAEATRQRIRAATHALLRLRSPARITRFDIGHAAEVDPALIRYYFGDKSNLFREVIRDQTDDLRARLNRLPAAGSASEQLRARLKVWLDFFAETPHFHELVVEEVFYGEKDASARLLTRFVDRAYPELEDLIARGIDSGDLRPVEPRFVYIALIALCEFFATASPLVEELFGRKKADRGLLEAYGEFAAELLVQGLKRRP